MRPVRNFLIRRDDLLGADLPLETSAAVFRLVLPERSLPGFSMRDEHIIDFLESQASSFGDKQENQGPDDEGQSYTNVSKTVLSMFVVRALFRVLPPKK